MNDQPHISVDAGLALWARIRSIAALHGLRIEESKGFFRRSFVLRGEVSGLLAAAEDLQSFLDA